MRIAFWSRRGRLWTTAAILALTGLSTAAFYVVASSAESTPSATAAPAQPPSIPVPVATVVEANVTTWDEFSGRLEAIERVEIRARVAGAIQSMHFVEGALVNRGDLLFTIDPAPYAAEVDRAQAQVAAAQARLTNAKNENERAQRLWDESAIARRELDERTNALREAEANVRATEAAQQAARLNLGYTQVRAPVSGRVGKADVTAGNLVAAGPGAAVLTTLVSVSPIYASFDADEQIVTRALKDLASERGARAQLSSIPVEMETAIDNNPRLGRLQLVDNQVNAKSGTVRVRAVFDNKDGSLMPGQFAKVRMGHSKPAPALLINERAVGTDQSKKFVMVVGPDNKVSYREVSLGSSVNGLRIVSSGLNPGERIVVSGLQRIRPGALVDPQPATMNALQDSGPRKALAQS
jgi:membrane fusion protein, multidrug efflux system